VQKSSNLPPKQYKTPKEIEDFIFYFKEIVKDAAINIDVPDDEETGTWWIDIANPNKKFATISWNKFFGAFNDEMYCTKPAALFTCPKRAAEYVAKDFE
jgi:hypothetical protein